MSKAREFWITPHIVGDATGGKQHWALPVKKEWMGDNMIHVREVLPVSEDVEEMAKKYIEDKQWAFYGRKLEYDRALEMYSAGHTAAMAQRDEVHEHACDVIGNSTEYYEKEITRLNAEVAIKDDANSALRSINKGIAEATTNLHAEITRLKDALGIAHAALKDFSDCSGDIDQSDKRLGWIREALTFIDKALEGK